MLKGNVPIDLNVIHLTIQLDTTNANPRICLYWTELPYQIDLYFNKNADF